MNILREMSGRGKRPYPIDRERRQRVMIALAEKDLTISSLARKLNVSKQYLSAVVIGRRLTQKTEQFIADYLGKSTDYLFPPRTSEALGKMRQAEAAAKKEKAA